MKIKALLATIIGAVAINGATAGDWCPPAKDKCPVECCPETAGNISVGYDTDYIWRGVRLARDIVWTDVNYSFDVACLPITPVIGAWHGTTLDSNNPLGNGAFNWGDETNLYAGAALPQIMGFNAQALYTHYLFPNQRGLVRAANNNQDALGDSFGSISVSVTRDMSDILCGLSVGAGSEYFLGGSPSQAPANDMSSWYHYAEGTYSLDVTDCIGVNLTAGVSYSDGLWSDRGFGNTGSGWNHYYIRAAAPIQIGCNAVLTPYVGYNGTPDGWVAGNANANILGAPTAPGANSQDAFHGGVSVRVGF